MSTSKETSSIIFDPAYTERLQQELDERDIAIRHGELKPYIGATHGIFKERAGQPSRALRKHPEVIGLIDDALETDDDDTLITAAQLIEEARASSQPTSSDTFNTVLSYVKLQRAMIEPMYTSKRGEPWFKYDGLSWLTRNEFLKSVPDEQIVAFMAVSHFVEYSYGELTQTALSQDKPDTADSYLRSSQAASYLQQDLRSRLWAAEYVRSLPAEAKPAPSPDTIEADSKEVARLFSDIRKSQNYGIKLGYLPHELGGNMIYGPISSEGHLHKAVAEDNAHPLRIEKYGIAEIIHSVKKSFKDLRPERRNTFGEVGYHYGVVSPAVLAFLNEEGDLFVDPHCLRPLMPAFVNQGKYDAYRQLQAKIIADYFDMTRPALTVERISRSMRASGPPSEDTASQTRQPMDSFQRLVIPRIRIEQELQSSPIEISPNEVEEAEIAVGSLREIRLHNVTWHRRKLPEGWQPSPQALEIATEAGIVLKPGETFVRQHKRGNKELGEIIGHAIIDSEL